MFEPTEPIRLFEKLSGKLIVKIFYAYIAKIIEFYVFLRIYKNSKEKHGFLRVIYDGRAVVT